MEIFGWIGMILVSIQFLPQLMKLIKTKKAKDVSLLMIVLTISGALSWILYAIFIKDIPVLLTNILIFIIACAILYLKIKYRQK